MDELTGICGPQAQEPVRLVIEMVNGNVVVSGPINNRLLCLGLLEVAKQTVIEHGQRAAQQQRHEQRALADILGDMRRRGG